MQFFAFSVSPEYVRDVVAAGVAGVVVDWELRGKARRHRGHDPRINRDTPADLSRVRHATAGRVLCRINAHGPWTPARSRTPSLGGRMKCCCRWSRRSSRSIARSTS